MIVFVESFASSAILSTISFLLIESIGIQDSLSSLLTAFFKESISMFLVFLSLLSSSKVIKFVAFDELPLLSSLNLPILLESPKIKKKRIETVK